jgi:hypothetical protein
MIKRIVKLIKLLYTGKIETSTFSVDLNTNQLILKDNFTIISNENLTIRSEKHIMLDTSKLPESRKGYYYSIWMNSKKDEEGNPLKDEFVFNNEVTFVEKKEWQDQI